MKFLGKRKRMTLRLPPTLGKQVDQLAASAGLSVNEYIVREVEKQVIRDELSKGDGQQP